MNMDDAKEIAFDATLNDIEQLRKDADAYTDQFETGGRHALNKLMSGIYHVYHDAVFGGRAKQLEKGLRSKLKALDPKLEPTKNAHMSNMLVRYVFKAPDAKQVSVYAKCLRVLADRSPAVQPDDFIDAVSKQKGGYSGFVENTATKVAKRQPSPALALSVVKNLPTLNKVSLDWNEGEEFRVLLAVPGSSDTEAYLKHIKVSPKVQDALMVDYFKEQEADRKALENATKKLAKEKEVVKFDREMEILAAEQKVTAAKMELSKAEKALAVESAKKPKANLEKFKEAKELAQSSLDVAVGELKAIKPSKK